MNNNLVLQSVLEDLEIELVNEEVLNPDFCSFFLDQKYFHLSKDFVKKVLDCEIGDNITAYGMECSKLGFQAGVDAILMILDKTPAYGIIERFMNGEEEK